MYERGLELGTRQGDALSWGWPTCTSGSANCVANRMSSKTRAAISTRSGAGTVSRAAFDPLPALHGQGSAAFQPGRCGRGARTVNQADRCTRGRRSRTSGHWRHGARGCGSRKAESPRARVAHQRLSVADELCYERESTTSRWRGCYRTLAPEGDADRAQEAGSLLQRLPVRRKRRPGRCGARLLMLQAILHQAQHDMPRALFHLEPALALGEPEGYVRTFVDEGGPMRDLLRHAVAVGRRRRLRRGLLAAFEAPGGRLSGNKGRAPAVWRSR